MYFATHHEKHALCARDAATYEAVRFEMPSRVTKVLVDHCALMNGSTSRLVAVTQTVNWGPVTVPIKVTRIQSKRLQKGEDWLRNERRSLAAVGAAARAGLIAAYTSMELTAERLKARMGGRGIRGDLWNDVSLEHVPAPLDRSTLMGSLSLEQMSSKDHRQEFYGLLLKFARDGVPEWLWERSPSNEFIELQKRNVGRLAEYATLCDVVGEARWGDAFHYWTALCNDLDYFLTTDKNFLAALREHPDKDLIFRAVTPSELVEVLGLPAAALPIEEGEIAPFATD